MRVALDWQVSSYFGWGVYGLNLALQWARDPSIEARALLRSVDDIDVDPISKRALVPFIRRSMLDKPLDAISIHALGNDVAPDGIIGAIFFEEQLSKDAVERLKRYDLIITGSTWNEDILRSHGVNVRTIFQGVDRSLFHPAPKRNLFPDRFLIFSGGKAEPRKGQDLVVKAFRVFAKHHRDAMLVTAWHSPWPNLKNAMDLDLSEVANQVIDVGPVPNSRMAAIYRECDVGLFPNRAEGGTNLVAMECLACGVPVILSKNTGHLDLAPTQWLERQSPSDHWSEWRESDIDEILDALEVAYRGCRSCEDESLSRFNWFDAANQMLDVIKQAFPAALAA